jgi:hypothetical protein
MAISKTARRIEAMERRQKREAAAAEVMESRMRGAIGFAGAYVASAILPRFAPTLSQPVGGTTSTLIDLGIALGGGYLALTDDGELGDYAFGAALVGTTQTLDRVVTGIETWLDSRAA